MHDPVTSPSHYQLLPGVEVIDVIGAVIEHAPTPMAGMCQGNALKYICRAFRKGKPAEDLRKARWYIDRLIAEVEANG